LLLLLLLHAKLVMLLAFWVLLVGSSSICSLVLLTRSVGSVCILSVCTMQSWQQLPLSLRGTVCDGVLQPLLGMYWLVL
jgi:hypothetical protein